MIRFFSAFWEYVQLDMSYEFCLLFLQIIWFPLDVALRPELWHESRLSYGGRNRNPSRVLPIKVCFLVDGNARTFCVTHCRVKTILPTIVMLIVLPAALPDSLTIFDNSLTASLIREVPLCRTSWKTAYRALMLPTLDIIPSCVNRGVWTDGKLSFNSSQVDHRCSSATCAIALIRKATIPWSISCILIQLILSSLYLSEKSSTPELSTVTQKVIA